MPSLSHSQRSRPSPRLGILIVFLILVAVIAGVGWLRRPTPPPVPMPPSAAGSAALDPQVEAHLQREAATVVGDPRSAAKWASLGMAYAANGLWSEARRAFQGAAILDPSEPLAPMYAAVALNETADPTEALREFKAVTEAFPRFAPAWYRTGDLAMRLGDPVLAERAYERLISLAPEEWRGPAGLAEVRLRQGQPEAAIPLLEKALQLDSSAKPARFLIGQAYRTVGRTNEARLALFMGTGSTRHPMPDPWSAEAPKHMKSLSDQLAQADELSAQGRPDLAVQLLAEAMTFHPNHAGLINQQAVALNRAGRPDRALGVLDALLRQDPNAIPPRITRSYTQVMLGRADVGLADAQFAADTSPQTAQAHLAVANALLAMDRDSEAVQALRDALRCEPGNAEIQLELGNVLWRNLGDKDAARTLFEQAIELNPALASAYENLGLLLLDSGNPEAARAVLKNLQSVAPGGTEVRTLRQALGWP